MEQDRPEKMDMVIEVVRRDLSRDDVGRLPLRDALELVTISSVVTWGFNGDYLQVFSRPAEGDFLCSAFPTQEVYRYTIRKTAESKPPSVTIADMSVEQMLSGMGIELEDKPNA